MKAFVTGSTGLLGSNLVKLLLEQGYEVKALARSPEKARKVLGTAPQLTIIKGDLEDIPGFVNELAGCDLLFHVAAYFREYYSAGDHWPLLEQINVKGTLTLLEAAEKYNLQKVIYVSSSGVIGKRSDGKPGDENTPPDAAVYTNLYFKSKVLAEEAVTAFLKTHKLPVVLILPTWMYGPQDAAPTAAGRLVLDFLNRQLPAIIPGGSAVVDARDVAQAMLKAVEHGKSGERYIISNEFQSLGSILQLLTKISGIPGPRLRLPYPLAVGMAWVVQTLASVRGQDALITVSGIRTMNESLAVSAAKAKRELGVTFRPFAETLRDTVQWYRQYQPERLR